MLSLNGVVNFVAGIFNATRTQKSDHINLCKKKVIDKWEVNAYKIANYTLQGFQVFKIGWSILDMVYNVDSISDVCYKSGVEFVWGLYGYGDKLDLRTAVDNVIFDFGNIFDAFRDTVLFFMDDARGEYDIPYDAGRGIGTALYMVLRPYGYPHPIKGKI